MRRVNWDAFESQIFIEVAPAALKDIRIPSPLNLCRGISFWSPSRTSDAVGMLFFSTAES